MARIFISGSMKIPIAKKKEVYNELKKAGLIPYYFDHGEKYTPETIHKADAIVLMTTDNKFKDISTYSLPTGVKRELREILNNNKPIFLCYKKSDGNISFYETQRYAGYINGISGTYGQIYKLNDKKPSIIIDDEPKKKVASKQLVISFEVNAPLLIRL